MKQFKKIYIEITNFCNLNCTFCAKSTRNKLFMNSNSFEHVIKQIAPFTDYVYLHVLGEPLLHPELDAILSICENYGLNVNITTNGTLLLNKLDILLKHKVRQYNISLHCEHGLDNETYFDNVFSACDKLCKDSYINYRNWRNDDAIINQAILKKYGVSILNKTKQTIDNNIFFSIEEAFDWEGKEKDNVGTCYGFKNICAILSDGKVTACCIDYDGSIDLGNVFESPFSEIVSSEKFLTLKKGIEENKFLCTTCQKCNYKKRFK